VSGPGPGVRDLMGFLLKLTAYLDSGGSNAKIQNRSSSKQNKKESKLNKSNKMYAIIDGLSAAKVGIYF
jgi:hypothetical protein